MQISPFEQARFLQGQGFSSGQSETLVEMADAYNRSPSFDWGYWEYRLGQAGFSPSSAKEVLALVRHHGDHGTQ